MYSVPLKYLRRVETRWLQIKAVVDRHLQLYDPLLEFFRQLPDPEKAKPKPRRILKLLEAPETQAYLGFVSFALAPFKRFEKIFQATEPIIHLLYPAMCDLFADVLHSFVRSSQIESLERMEDMKDITMDQQLSNEHIIIGDVARKALRNDYLKASDRARFFSNVRAFYLTLLRAMRHYLPLKQRLLRALQMLDPKKATHVSEADVIYLSKKIGFTGDHDALRLEWRHFIKEDHELPEGNSVENFWNVLCNEEKFPSLVSVARRGLLVPHGNADTERLFSSLKRILRKERNLLQDPSLNGLLNVKAFHAARQISSDTMKIDACLRDHVRAASAKYAEHLKQDARAKHSSMEAALARKKKEEDSARKKKENEECRQRKEDRAEKRKLAVEHMEMAKKLMAELEDEENSEKQSEKK